MELSLELVASPHAMITRLLSVDARLSRSVLCSDVSHNPPVFQSLGNGRVIFRWLATRRLRGVTTSAFFAFQWHIKRQSHAFA